jgi:hypothetical protein
MPRVTLCQHCHGAGVNIHSGCECDRCGGSGLRSADRYLWYFVALILSSALVFYVCRAAYEWLKQN